MKNLSAILWLFAANSISGVAQGVSMIAIPWYFAQRQETQNYAVVYLLVTATALVWGPLCGIFVDKYNRKNIFLTISAVSCSILLGIASYGYYLGALPLYLVAAVFAMTFFNYNIHYPTLYAFVQEITEEKYFGKVASYIEIQGQVTAMFAGAVGALLLEGLPDGTINTPFGVIQLPFSFEKWEIHDIFLLDAATYFIAILLLLMIRYTPTVIRSEEVGSLMERLKTGYQYLQSNSLLFLFGVASYSIFVSILLTIFYLGAIYVNNHLQAGADVYASMEISYAIGALLAGFFANRIFSRFHKVDGILLLMFVAVGLFATLFLSKSVIVFYFMMGLLGLTNAGTRILRINFLFEHVPNQVFGRAGSIFFLTNVSFRLFFMLMFWLPFFHFENNIIYAFLIISVFILVSALILLGFRRRLIKI